MSRRRAFGVAAAVVAAPPVARLGWAQAYPSRPVRVIVPVAAGGGANSRAVVSFALGFDPVASTPDYFAEWIRAEIAKWRKVIRDGNISVQ